MRHALKLLDTQNAVSSADSGTLLNVRGTSQIRSMTMWECFDEMGRYTRSKATLNTIKLNRLFTCYQYAIGPYQEPRF